MKPGHTGLEPVLGGDAEDDELSGFEPDLGGEFRLPVNPRLWKGLMSRNYRRIRRAVGEIQAVNQRARYTNTLIMVVRNEPIEGKRRFSARDRRSAIEALSLLNDASALQPIIETLNDESWEVRQYAAWALGEMGDYRAIEPLLAALEDENPYVRVTAADALTKFNTSRRARAALNHFWASVH